MMHIKITLLTSLRLGTMRDSMQEQPSGAHDSIGMIYSPVHTEVAFTGKTPPVYSLISSKYHHLGLQKTSKVVAQVKTEASFPQYIHSVSSACGSFSLGPHHWRPLCAWATFITWQVTETPLITKSEQLNDRIFGPLVKNQRCKPVYIKRK